MAIRNRIENTQASILMEGRFDFQVHREFRAAYMSVIEDHELVTEIAVDLSRVDYIDSSAMGMLLLLDERAKSNGKSVSLVDVSEAVSHVLDVANFGKIFNIQITSRNRKSAHAAY